MNSPTTSLVKYDNPVLVSKKPSRSQQSKSAVQQLDTASLVPTPPKDSAKLPPVTNGVKSQTEEILNEILPPRELTENGALWIQQVSSTPATRMDVINLQELLDAQLQQRHARETGICPDRRELFSNCMDELIRHVAINCGERGLFLKNVRDEIKMNMEAYQTLYESSVAFGMRKALYAELGKTEMEEKIVELEEEKDALLKQVSELEAKCAAITKQNEERWSVEQRKYQEEMDSFRQSNKELTQELMKRINGDRVGRR